MTYYNWEAPIVITGRASAGALYYNCTAALRKDQAGSEPTFSQVLGQSMGRSGSADMSVLSSSLDSIFEEAAAKYQVDVNLLRAIGKAESGFDPSAVSCAGAVGVMQLMPATASSLGVSNPYDAKENIMGGASYIAGLLKQYGGDVSLALAAYNAGSGNVAKYGGIPPFAETQAYVEKVMGYAGQEAAVSDQTPGPQSEAVAEGEAEQADLTEYWGHMVELMRFQLEMKLAGILSSGVDEELNKGIGI